MRKIGQMWRDRPQVTPQTLHPALCTLHPTPYSLLPSPYCPHPTPCTLHPTPYSLLPTPHTLHPTPKIGQLWRDRPQVPPNVKRFRGGLVFKARRWLYHSTLGSSVIKKKKKIGQMWRDRPQVPRLLDGNIILVIDSNILLVISSIIDSNIVLVISSIVLLVMGSRPTPGSSPPY